MSTPPRFSPSVAIVSLIVICFLSSTLAAFSQDGSEFRQFTSTDGKTIEAKAISLSGGTIKIEMKNGRTFDLPVARLSPEDQQWIGEWNRKMAGAFVPDLKIAFDENIDKSTDETGFVNIETFSPQLKITNQESTFELTRAKVTTLLIVEDVEKGDVFTVLSKETVPLSLTAGESNEWEGRKVETRYATIKAYGGKYAGHAVIVENEAGTIIAHDGSRGWDKNPEYALKAQEGAAVLKGFKAP